MSHDFTPFFRTAIGFDQLVNRVQGMAQDRGAQSYPPYNIEKSADGQYRLTMAVAGFSEDDLEITVQDNTLTVAGRVASEPSATLLHRGIAGRAFERRFALADHVVVEQAELRHGLLHIGLRRVVPDALKPRRIAIGTGAPTAAIGQAQAQAA